MSGFRAPDWLSAILCGVYTVKIMLKRHTFEIQKVPIDSEVTF